MRSLFIWTILLFCMGWANLAGAEVVSLKNGRTLTGRITHQDEVNTHLELDIGGVIILSNTDIVKITNAGDKVVFSPPQPVNPVPPTSTPAPGMIEVIRPTATPSPTATQTCTETPLQLRPIKFRRVDKQEHRTLLARRFVYHIVVEEKIENWETRLMLIRLMNLCKKDAKYADAIEVRLYGTDPRGKTYDWPFAVAIYAPNGDWDKADASIPRSKFLLKLKVQDEVEYLKY